MFAVGAGEGRLVGEGGQCLFLRSSYEMVMKPRELERAAKTGEGGQCVFSSFPLFLMLFDAFDYFYAPHI